jgi:hypothetical protein
MFQKILRIISLSTLKFCILFLVIVFLAEIVLLFSNSQLIASPKDKSENLTTSLPDYNDNRVAYYAFDATPVNQGKLRLTNFTDNANIVIVFEGTLWELAYPENYGSNSSYILNINGGPYSKYEQILDDIQTLRKRGIKVLMNVDDKDTWSTSVPFLTWDGKKYNYKQFAKFVYDCTIKAGFDGISLDVEHGAIDNSYYRNVIKELGNYFGPLSSNKDTMIYTGAFYSGGSPGPSFRDINLGKYFNFVMDMAYFQNDSSRFNYWANSLGNSKVMIGMSHEYNNLNNSVSHAKWHPTPDKAGIMVFAGNVNKEYTDTIFDSLGSEHTSKILTPYVNINNEGWKQTSKVSIFKGGTVVLGPGPDTGSWEWKGPNNYTASTREITIRNIRLNQSGQYIATNINKFGAKNTLNFSINIK